MKPMSWLWGGWFSRRFWFWFWRRGRLGCSMLDCCLSREPRAAADGLRGAAFPLEPAAKGEAAQSDEPWLQRPGSGPLPGLELPT